MKWKNEKNIHPEPRLPSTCQHRQDCQLSRLTPANTSNKVHKRIEECRTERISAVDTIASSTADKAPASSTDIPPPPHALGTQTDRYCRSRHIHIHIPLSFSLAASVLCINPKPIPPTQVGTQKLSLSLRIISKPRHATWCWHHRREINVYTIRYVEEVCEVDV